jgi:AhpD family alkylhydroperoxidase
MTRLAEIKVESLTDQMRAHFEAASQRDRMLLTPTGHAPELMTALHDFAGILAQRGSLPGRLVELVRLRIAFHNQCRSCMAMRYQSGLDDGLTENAVCSLEKPEEAPDLSEAEKAALAYADISATNHFAITADTFEALRQHFTEPQIVELGLYVAYFIGFGRLVAAWDLVEELPDGFQDKTSRATPWSGSSFVVGR